MRLPADRIVHTTAFVIAVVNGTRNNSISLSGGINPMTHHTVSKCSITDLHPIPTHKDHFLVKKVHKVNYLHVYMF